MHTAHTVRVPVYKLTIQVDGFVKVQRVDEKEALTSPKKFKGWLKQLAKLAMADAGIQLPAGQVKGVVRYIDFLHQEKNPVNFVRLAATPLNQLYGVPAKNLEWYARSGVRLTPEVTAALLAISRFGAIKVLVKEAPTQLIRYTQGVRDDISTTATENPHEVILVKFLKPIEVTVTVQPTAFDVAMPVPEWAEPPYPPAKTYLEAYEKLLDAAVELAKAGVLSPFGGRDVHTVRVEARKEYAERRVAPIPPQQELARIQRVWGRLPQLLARR